MYRGHYVVLDHPICACSHPTPLARLQYLANGQTKLMIQCRHCGADYSVPVGDLMVVYRNDSMPAETRQESANRLKLLLDDAEKR